MCCAQVLPPLTLVSGGRLVLEETGEPAMLRGLNWFGWNVGAFNMDGMWVSSGGNSAKRFY
jgi:hypothetical protein